MILAAAPLFHNPVVGPLLRLVGALPVLRRQEGIAERSRNDALFGTVAEALGRGGAVLLFPEGRTQPEPVLLPLRTGAARMLLGAAGQGTPVTLLPMGLVFNEPGTFRIGAGARRDRPAGADRRPRRAATAPTSSGPSAI